MKHTYELYLTDADGRSRFIPLTCEPDEVMALAQRLQTQEGAVSAEVRQLGRSLFVITGDPPGDSSS